MSGHPARLLFSDLGLSRVLGILIQRVPAGSVSQALGRRGAEDGRFYPAIRFGRQPRFDAAIQVKMTFQWRNLARISPCGLAGFLRPIRIFAVKSYSLPA